MSTVKPLRPPTSRPNYHQIHSKPLPVETYPLPTFFPHNPLSYIRIAFTLLSHFLSSPSSHPKALQAYYDTSTRSVHVTDHHAIRALWERGFFGKGSLSRSEPEWLERERKRLGLSRGRTAGEVTRSRREERREAKRARARAEAEEVERQIAAEAAGAGTGVSRDGVGDAEQGASVIPGLKRLGAGVKEARRQSAKEGTAGVVEKVSLDDVLIELEDKEHLQLTPAEAFFLQYALSVVTIHDPITSTHLTTAQLLQMLRQNSTFPPTPAPKLQPDDDFLLSYVTYHHFRSLGWVVRPGIKFAVDYLLYSRGPVFSHAEFAVLILPSFTDARWRSTPERREHVLARERREWWWLQGANRVQAHVLKTLVLCYVDVPTAEAVAEVDEGDLGGLLRLYSVREVALRRWVASRNRD